MIRWKPTASIENQRLRAQLLIDIRKFFAERNVLEVETPLLSQYTVTDIHTDSFHTSPERRGGGEQHYYYLQTSPEYAMKRLLAAGSGPIFQICKAFRNDEIGLQHNPEFSLLEWYRLDFSCQDLMDETEELLRLTLASKKVLRLSYEELFLQYVGINPWTASLNQLQSLAEQFSFKNFADYKTDDRDTLLQFLFSETIGPQIGFDMPLFVYYFPASQAALAKIHPQNPTIALRFEVYIQGIECANGFEELIDAKEQQQRFVNDNIKRCQQGLPPIEIDKRFLTALSHGLPPCAGIAVGLDRLLMIKAKTRNILDVMSFPWIIA